MNVLVALIFGMILAAAAAIAVVVMLKAKRVRADRDLAGVIAAYFAKSGVNVTVLCVTPAGGKPVVLVESEPLKKFRYSFVIEKSLIDYIRKNYGIKLEQVFWRFPLQQKDEGAQTSRINPAATEESEPPPKQSAAPEPAVLAMSLSDGKVEDHYKVDEISWENYESALQPGASKEGGGPTTS